MQTEHLRMTWKTLLIFSARGKREIHISVAVAVFLSTYIYFSLLIHITTKEYPQKPIYINYKVHDACRKSRNLNPIFIQYPGSFLTRSPRLSAVFSVRSNRPLYFHSLNFTPKFYT
jgi:hypothetical protein